MIQAIGDATMFLECFSLFYAVFQIDLHEKTGKRLIGIIGCIFVWLMGIILGLSWRGMRIGPFPLFLVIVFALIFFMFDISIPETLAIGVGAWQILSILEGIPHLLVRRYGLEKPVETILAMLITVAIIWLFRLEESKWGDGVLLRFPVKIWVILDLILFVITSMLTFFKYVLTRIIEDEHRLFLGEILSAFGGVVILLLFFVMLYCYNEMNSYRIQKELAEEYNEQQREYFMRMLEKEDETRRFRHDIIDDLVEMQFFCKKGKYEELESYLENTLGVVQNIRQNSYDVGNEIINTVFNYYLQPLKDKYDIKVKGYVSDDISMNSRDLCILSANLVKNASEAVCKLPEGKIDIDIDQGKNYLIMKVENSFDGRLSRGKRGRFNTFKKDKKNHGIGITNIKEVVKKYDGTYFTDVMDGVFGTEICIRCNR